MVLNLQVIELIAQLAIELGEHIIPEIVRICHPDEGDGHQKQYADDVLAHIHAKHVGAPHA